MQSGKQIGALKNSRIAVSTGPNEPKPVYSVDKQCHTRHVFNLIWPLLVGNCKIV